MQARFPFRFDPAYRRLARLFGVKPERAWVDLGDEELEARYGRWRVRTSWRLIASNLEQIGIKVNLDAVPDFGAWWIDARSTKKATFLWNDGGDTQ